MGMEHKKSANLTRIHALSKVSIALSETLSLDRLLYEAVTQCIETLRFDAAVVYFLDSTGEYFIAKHFYGVSYESMGKLRKLPTDFIGGLVVKNGKTVITEDLVQYYEKRPQIEEFKSLISVPIKVRKETIGVLDVFTKQHKDFSVEDISLIESIGLQLGVASENARLFESIDTITTKLRELVQLNHQLSSCLDLEYLMKQLTSELGRVFKAKVMVLSITENKSVRVRTSRHYNGLLLNYDTSVDWMFHQVPNKIHHFECLLGDLHQVSFFGKFGIKTAKFVTLTYREHRHCLIIGKHFAYEWTNTELEVLEGICKTISLALTNSYLFLEVEKSRQLNSNLRSIQVTAQENERKRIAQEIHDSINQSLSGIYFHLQYCRDEINHSPEKVKSILDKLLFMTKDNINELRQIIHDLHPFAIQKFGFVGAVEDLVKTCSLQGMIHFQLFINGEPIRYDADVEIHLYRVIQESINNIIKHSQATDAFIQMDFEDSKMRVIVKDLGIGFDTQKTSRENRAFGLMGMKSRVQDIGGSISISSQVGSGTVIEIVLQHNKMRGGRT